MFSLTCNGCRYKTGDVIDDLAEVPRTRLESFLRMMGSVKVQSVVHCQRDLVGNEREKADFLPAIGIGFYTAHSEAAESPVHCRQRKRAYRTNAAFLEHRGNCWETSLPV